MKTQTKQEADNLSQEDLPKIFYNLMEAIDEDPNRDGLKETWERRAPEMWKTVTEGYDEENKPDMASFPAEIEGLVVKKNIPFYSLCEHHLLPFFGKVHIGYLPGEEIVGLSKLIRYTRWKSRKLGTQERLTREIAEGLSEELDPEGIIVTVEAQHMCESMRGVETPDTTTSTTSATGVFKESSQEQNPRREFLDRIDL